MEETVLSVEMRKKNKRVSKLFYSLITAALMATISVIAVFAADGDPVAAVNRTTDFIFSVLSAAGLAILAFGVFQLGMSFKNHDPSQRAQGVMAVVGGVVIAMARPIANMIVGG